MKSKTLMLSINVAIYLFCAITGDVHAWFSLPLGGDTHKGITKDVLNNLLPDQPLVLEDYPDLVMFGNQLRDGSNQESHNLPDGMAVDWWMPTFPSSWFNADITFEPDGSEECGALFSYTNYFFQAAYARIGYELHLVQDEQVPAHESYCFHGIPLSNFDYLEGVASTHHAYATTTTPWSYIYSHFVGDTVVNSEFQYWLADDMDDDNFDEEADSMDEWDYGDNFIIDGPDAYGVPNFSWGTYGQPVSVFVSPYWRIAEKLPGRNQGLDYFASSPKLSIVEEQLQKAYVVTLQLLKLRSTKLPPLIPDDDTNGKPTTSLDIFGPNKPVNVSFHAMENRKPMVFVSILVGSSGIKNWSGKIWDGGANATEVLSSSSPLPWKSSISTDWNGESSTGQIDDGTHVISMQVKDYDDNLSEKRTRSVMFDKTKPIATTIVFNCYPKKSSS